MLDMVGLPIILAALLGFVIFGGDSGGTTRQELDGEGIDPSEGDDDGSLTDGDDVFNALGGDDRIAAGDGDDTVLGGEGDDILLGELGDDSLDGGAGDDTLYGGFGDDTLTSDEGAIFMFGAEGNDTITATAGDGRIGGGEGDDKITTTDANVTIVGGEGADEISVTGGEGIKVYGGPDDDLITGSDALGTYLSGDLGDDRVAAVGGRIDGGEGADVLASYGSYDEDAVIEANGESGDDDPRTALYGGEGDDQLWGVEGNTIMTGGAGADEFHTQDRATIEDFEPGEDVLIIDLLYNADTAGAGTAEASDFEIVLTEIDINGVASTLVETRVAAGAVDTADVENLNQTVWIKGVTPSEIGDDDIELSLVSTADNETALAGVFSNAPVSG